MKKSTFKFLAVVMFAFMGTFAMAQTQYEVTFNVDMTGVEVFNAETDAIYMSGTFAGWAEPGTDEAFKMTAVEGTMTYTLTATVDSGEVMYKYFRVIDGATSWDNGEWTGDPNRKVYLTAASTLEDTWADKPFEITFNVDMTGADPFDPATDAIYIGGSLANGWAMPGSLAPYMLTSEDEVNYSITLLLYPGDYQYKYFRIIDGVPSWDNGEWTGDPNREVTTDTVAATIDNVWGEIASIFTQPNEFTYNMYPNPVVSVLNIANTNDVTNVEVFDMNGRLVQTMSVIAQQNITLNVAELQTGVYFVNVHNEKGVQTAKFVKN